MLKLTIRSFITIFLLIGYTFVFANAVKAEEKQFCIGIGGSYQINNLALDEGVVDWERNSWGINAKFGYRLTHTVFFQFDVDYLPEIEGVYKPDNSVGEEVEVLTGIFSLKGYLPNTTPLKPFVIAGFGIMHYDIDLNDEAISLGYYLKYEDETSLCFKVGGGLDVFINQSASIGVEANYTAGDSVGYYNFILGASYYF
jgi:opacity protein-like surface antigen